MGEAFFVPFFIGVIVGFIATLIVLVLFEHIST